METTKLTIAKDKAPKGLGEGQVAKIDPQLQKMESDIQFQLERRKVIYKYLLSSMKKDVDYFLIDGRKSLGKAGAEKVCSLLGVTVGEPEIHEPTMAVLPEAQTKAGAIVYMIRLYRGSEVIGSGIGARKITQDSGDINKTIKMAKKSALSDAVLSTFGLSDLFTQDLENDGDTPPPAKPKVMTDGGYVAKVLKATKGVSPDGTPWSAILTEFGKARNASGTEMTAENTYSFMVEAGKVVSVQDSKAKAQEKLDKLNGAK